jgi:phosphatidate cytidylyltransferase
MAVGELTQRIATAAVILPIFGFALFVGEDAWTLLMVVLAMLMTLEWQNLSLRLSLGVKIAGIPYIALAIASASMLRRDPFGLDAMLFVIACVVVTDTAAYFGGKRYGKRKLALSISPNKTWEGLGCGVLAAAVTGAGAAALEGYPYTLLGGVAIGAALAVASQMGDLLESAIKRRAGVKDSGAMLPGHGGLLDRMDGYLTALPLFYGLVMWDNYYGTAGSAAI